MLVILCIQSYGSADFAIGANWNLLPDTGQNDCYDSIGDVVTPCLPAGQDGQYQGLAPSYTDNGDTTITDNNTNLIWQKSDDATLRSWSDAVTYCDTLVIGTMQDWRLPEKFELQSIIDYGRVFPAIDTTYFTLLSTEDEHWTNTTTVADANNAWTITLGGGGADYRQPKTTTLTVRCVSD